ncbi:MAG TPA: peptidoglycan synthetase [Saprospiraceae bacterium]|nr:peptidoglycan synthetase [Saprospiraceae bacterium]
MRIHLIAIGGAVMHNLAIALAENGHLVTGSDDEIYNPSRDRLAAKGLLPKKMGWFLDNISPKLDLVILGKHARDDNPEMLKAKELGLKVLSFPEFIYEHSKDKTRVVVTGSHGKTSTTAMIMHVLKDAGMAFDYLVGSKLDGFETMVGLSDAPIMVIEGDEYPASPLDLRPKMLFYKPNIAVTTGIAWDHINVFPTFENYVLQFEKLLKVMAPRATWIWYQNDRVLRKLAQKAPKNIRQIPYRGFKNYGTGGDTIIHNGHGEPIRLSIFGKHNLENLKSAYHAVRALGISDRVFFESIGRFKGAAKRLQTLLETETGTAFIDFAHAPSKAKATIQAVRAKYPKRKLIACLELHTFSSLNKEFLPHYKGTMAPADFGFVYYSPHTLEMKKLPFFSPEEVKKAFGGQNVRVFTDSAELEAALRKLKGKNNNILWMSSGNFGGLDAKSISAAVL